MFSPSSDATCTILITIQTQDFYTTTRSQTLFPTNSGVARAFRSLDAYNEARQDGSGSKMASVLATIQWFIKVPCQTMPKFDEYGLPLADSLQDAPYRGEAWPTTDKIMVYSKFTQNFPMIQSVCPLPICSALPKINASVSSTRSYRYMEFRHLL